MENTKTEWFVIDQHKFRQILERRDIPASAKLILFNLLYRLGGKSYSFPSQERIGRDIGLTGRNVRKMLKLLKEKGVISWKRGAYNRKTGSKTNSNQYDLSQLLVLKEL